MPIGGFVINVDVEEMEQLLPSLAAMEGVEVHGHDEQGNVVAVIDCQDSGEMEGIVKKINGLTGVLSVGLTYLNVEDEEETTVPGERVPGIFRGDPASQPPAS
ncbi:MAG: chaperone NapD [Thermodesulfobacteriota bacterium]